MKNFFHFNEADKAEITLYVEEFPFPNITCYKDSKEIIFCIGKKMKGSPNFNLLACEQDQYGLNGVPQLIIQSISFVRDDGNYTCVATTNNPPGRDVVSFYVNVGGIPRFFHLCTQQWPKHFCCLVAWQRLRLFFVKLHDLELPKCTNFNFLKFETNDVNKLSNFLDSKIFYLISGIKHFYCKVASRFAF